MVNKISAAIISFLSRWGYPARTSNGLSAVIYQPNCSRVKAVADAYQEIMNNIQTEQEGRFIGKFPLSAIAAIKFNNEKVYFLFIDPFKPADVRAILHRESGYDDTMTVYRSLGYCLGSYPRAIMFDDGTIYHKWNCMRMIQKVAEAVDHKQNPRIYALIRSN